MISIVSRILKQIFNDKRSLFLMVFVPIFLLTLLYFILGKSGYVPKVATVNLSPNLVAVLQEEDGITLTEKDSDESDVDYIKSGKADAVISEDTSGINVVMLEVDTVKTTEVNEALKEAIASFNPNFSINMSFVYGDVDESTFNSIGYLIIGILSFFIIFIFSGISFVRERTSGTVERLMLTPVKTVSVVMGYICGFGIFAVIQSVLLIVFSKFVLDMPFSGEWWIASIIMLLTAVIAVMFGILVSAISKNEFQVMQFIPVIIVPQFFFTGIISIDTMPLYLSYIAKIMPLYYCSMGLKKVLVYGDGIGNVLPFIIALGVFILILFIVNILAVRRYRAR
ncbi:MAG: ABC transporter permease [Eubacteriales bacterium]